MARTDLVESSAARSLAFGGDRSGSGMMKRKTPSELREEQLKRKKGDFLRTKKYIDTRVSEVYPIKKSSERCRLPNGKEKAKELLADDNVLNETIFPSANCGFPSKEISQPLCDRTGKLNSSECSNPFAKDIGDQGSLKIEKYNQHNVAELHLGKKLSDSPKIDMENALKGLVPRQSSITSAKLAESSGKNANFPSISGNLYSEFCIKGNKPPLDFTLKTNLRLVSSSSVKWFVTGCSRGPLLGFKFLESKFCIQRAAPLQPSEDDLNRLPTSATCMNLLKLPPYRCHSSCELS